MLVKRRVRQRSDEDGDEDELDAIEEGTESDPRAKPSDLSQSTRQETKKREDDEDDGAGSVTRAHTFDCAGSRAVAA